MDYWGGGGGGGAKGMLAPPLKLLGGPGPPSSYAYVGGAHPPLFAALTLSESLNYPFTARSRRKFTSLELTQAEIRTRDLNHNRVTVTTTASFTNHYSSYCKNKITTDFQQK